MDDVELEIEMPTPQGGDNDTAMNIESGRRPLLNLAKFSAKKNDFDEEDGLKATSSTHKGTGGAGERIYKDYNVTLNFTDVSYGERGSNKYYKIQILQGKNEFILFTEWGRVGAPNPGSARENFSYKEEAIKGFKKKFSKKTLNDWDDRENFRAHEGKYTLLKMAEGAGNKDSINKEIQRLNKRNQEIKLKIETKQSRLEPRIFELMKMIWDINRMNRTLKELNFDTDKYPLGKLGSEQIHKGYQILNTIQNVLLSDGKQSKLIELTNEFYTNIPQNFGFTRPPTIDNTTTLKDKITLLDALKELDIANKYINLALYQQGSEDINPLDSFFQILNAKINRVDPSENIFNVIQNCLRVTHGPTHDKYSLSVTDLFEVQRKGENERFWPFRKLNNRVLLWHGSRITNFVGILTEGLKIAPPDAPITGYMFGKGVYFADVPSKSANYCYPTPENPEGLLLLCEVALGDMYRVYEAKPFKKPPKYFHSVYGVGKKKPVNDNKIYMDEAVLECGEVKDNKELENQETGRIDKSTLQYNEFIVYDVGQVTVLVWCKSNIYLGDNQIYGQSQV